MVWPFISQHQGQSPPRQQGQYQSMRPAAFSRRIGVLHLGQGGGIQFATVDLDVRQLRHGTSRRQRMSGSIGSVDRRQATDSRSFGLVAGSDFVVQPGEDRAADQPIEQTPESG